MDYDQMRAYVDADRAMRAQAAPAVVASPLTAFCSAKPLLLVSHRKSVGSSVQRKPSISYADAQTLYPVHR